MSKFFVALFIMLEISTYFDSPFISNLFLTKFLDISTKLFSSRQNISRNFKKENLRKNLE